MYVKILIQKMRFLEKFGSNEIIPSVAEVYRNTDTAKNNKSYEQRHLQKVQRSSRKKEKVDRLKYEVRGSISRD